MRTGPGLLLLALAACGEFDGPRSGQTHVAVRLVIGADVPAQQAGAPTYDVEVRVDYLRGLSDTGAGQVQLADIVRQDVGNGETAIPLQVDIGPCLDDATRASRDGSCPLELTLTLRQGAEVLDVATVGPISLLPGQSYAASQPIVLQRVVSLALTWPGMTSGIGDTLRVGRTLALQVAALDATGAAVTPGSIT